MNRDIEGHERRAFVHWLRTGRLLPHDEPLPQWKFNPWHDPEDGRFTFRDAGRYFGFGSEPNRDTMGGGGATGSWPAPVKPQPFRPKTEPPRKRPGAMVATVVAAAAHRLDNGPRTLHLRNGYRFETDRLHRTRYTDAHLKLGRASPRSRLAQARAGGSDRLSGDDGGHFIAHRFNGPGDSFNHFAQSARFNRGAYRALEDKWARALRAGESVHVRITPTYLGASLRPSSLRVEWTIEGHTKSRYFPN